MYYVVIVFPTSYAISTVILLLTYYVCQEMPILNGDLS